jgi:hypothetical protein
MLVVARDAVYIGAMTKRVVDLTTEELDRLADEAWSGAARDALSKGFAVTGSENGRLYRHHPDGRIEDLGPVAPLPPEATVKKKKSRQSVA